ncbi:MAG: hypothetical protein AAB657_00385 [Patescibacteria group bacterium]
MRGLFVTTESGNEIWYVNPTNNKRYYIGSVEDLYQIMRTVGLGITNDNLNTITTGQF